MNTRWRSTMRAGFLAFVSSGALVLAAACADDPTRPVLPQPQSPPTTAPITAASPSMLAEGVVVIDATALRLVSTTAERNRGTYRYRRLTPRAAIAQPGQVIVGVTDEGQAYLRRVLAAAHSGDEVSLETVPAYWPEVLKSGRYEYEVAVGGGQGSGGLSPSLSRTTIGGSFDLPDAGPVTIEVDWCGNTTLQIVADELEALNPDLAIVADELRSFQLCNRPDDVCHSIGNRLLTVCGNLTALRTEGSARLTGTIGIAFTLDAGSVEVTDPGVPPSFSPCSTDPGNSICFDVADWVAWVQQVLNSPPLNVGFPTDRPPPTKVCVPGTPYFVPTEDFPFFETRVCAITDLGTAPTIVVTPPSLTAAGFENRLQLDYELTTTIAGRGSFEFELPIPQLSKTGKSDLPADGWEIAYKFGYFLVLGAEIAETELTIAQTTSTAYALDAAWNPTAGWTSAADAQFSASADLGFVRPDTIFLRAGLRELAFATASIPILPVPGGALVLVQDAKINVGVEDTWSSAPDCPSTPPSAPAPLCGNWKHDLDLVETASLEYAMELPLGFLFPQVDLSATIEKEVARADLVDLYGRGDLEATVTTSGEPLLDPFGSEAFGGYELRLDRLAPVGSGAPQPYFATNPLALDANKLAVVLSGSTSGPAGTHFFSNSAGVEWIREGFLGRRVRCRETYDVLTGDIANHLNCSLAAGVEHFLSIRPIGINCTVLDAAGVGNSSAEPATYWRSVRLVSEDTVSAPLSVQCAPPVGAVEVTTATIGVDLDPDGFDVLLDGARTGTRAPANGSTRLADVRVGSHSVGLDGNAFNCEVAPFDHVVLVPYNGTAGPAVSIQCVGALPTMTRQVETFLATGEIDKTGVGKALLSKLEAAATARARGDIGAVIDLLESFIEQVEDQAGVHISATAAVQLAASARYVLESGILSGSPGRAATSRSLP